MSTQTAPRPHTDTDYTFEYENNTDPGTAYVVITGKGNFSGTAK